MSRFIPLLLVFLSMPAMAQITIRNGVSSKQVDQLLQQMQGSLANGSIKLSPEQQQQMQQGLVFMQVYSCTEQVVGKERLDAFANKVKAVGQQVEALCKQARPTEARALALGALKTHANDPVAVAARNCYNDHKPQIEPLLASANAKDVANYERWLEDPALAAQEVREGDICKGSPNVQAAPAAPITTQTVQDIK